jgi:hypothetical protein
MQSHFNQTFLPRPLKMSSVSHTHTRTDTRTHTYTLTHTYIHKHTHMLQYTHTFKVKTLQISFQNYLKLKGYENESEWMLRGLMHVKIYQIITL